MTGGVSGTDVQPGRTVLPGKIITGTELTGKRAVLPGRALDVGKGAHELHGRLPVPLIVVGIRVTLHPVGSDGGFQPIPAVYLLKSLDEIRGADGGVHSVSKGSPGAVVALLEQSAGIRPTSVTVIQNLQPRLPQGNHDADNLALQRQVQIPS